MAIRQQIEALVSGSFAVNPCTRDGAAADLQQQQPLCCVAFLGGSLGCCSSSTQQKAAFVFLLGSEPGGAVSGPSTAIQAAAAWVDSSGTWRDRQ